MAVSKMVDKLFQEEHNCNNKEVYDYNKNEENVVMDFSDIGREGDKIEDCSLVQDSNKDENKTETSFRQMIDLEAWAITDNVNTLSENNDNKTE
eukprot:2753063-Ditylum_brightwellii.AAC.1